MLTLTTTATTVSYSQHCRDLVPRNKMSAWKVLFFFSLMTPDRLPWTLLSPPDVLNCAISSWCFMSFFCTQNSRTHSDGFRDRVHQKVFCIKSTGLIFNLCWNVQYLSLYKVKASALGSWECPHICLGSIRVSGGGGYFFCLFFLVIGEKCCCIFVLKKCLNF